MKKIAWHICSLIGMMFLLTVVSAQAQTTGRYRAHIPFDFTIGQETFQAGDYVVSLAMPTSSHTTLKLWNTTSGKARVRQLRGRTDAVLVDGERQYLKRLANDPIKGEVELF